uniref:Restriction alleviation protein, Lar family n=1 Tax=uncultured bacterium Contig643 TaxID=1393602 RepID=W0FMN0_9BACT|nr:predicted protein [uncultured bacterium Contig643]
MGVPHMRRQEGCTMNKPTLKSCPFCGRDEAYYSGMAANYRYIECSGCGASGPAAETDEEAAALWNDRAVPEIPKPHGKLVDADDLIKMIDVNIEIEGEENAKNVTKAFNEILDTIRGMEPVVDAEGKPAKDCPWR